MPFLDCLPGLEDNACSGAVQVREAQQGLSAAISRWEGFTGDALQDPRALLEASQDGGHPMHQLEHQVVQLQADLKQHTLAAKSAARYCASLFALFPEDAVQELSQFCLVGTLLLGQFASHTGWGYHKIMLRTDLFGSTTFIQHAPSSHKLNSQCHCYSMCCCDGMACPASALTIPLPTCCAACVRSGSLTAHWTITVKHSIAM